MFSFSPSAHAGAPSSSCALRAPRPTGASDAVAGALAAAGGPLEGEKSGAELRARSAEGGSSLKVLVDSFQAPGQWHLLVFCVSISEEMGV